MPAGLRQHVRVRSCFICLLKVSRARVGLRESRVYLGPEEDASAITKELCSGATHNRVPGQPCWCIRHIASWIHLTTALPMRSFGQGVPCGTSSSITWIASHTGHHSNVYEASPVSVPSPFWYVIISPTQMIPAHDTEPFLPLWLCFRFWTELTGLLQSRGWVSPLTTYAVYHHGSLKQGVESTSEEPAREKHVQRFQ